MAPTKPVKKYFLKAKDTEKIDLLDTKTIENAYKFSSNIVVLEKVTLNRFMKDIPLDDVKAFMEENKRNTAKDDAKILKLMKKHPEVKQCLPAKQFFDECVEKCHQLLSDNVDGSDKNLMKLLEFHLFQREQVDDEMNY